MPVAAAIAKSLSGSSWIRKMFEEGIKLKAEFGADKVYDFSIGNPDLEPPREFHEAFVALATEDAPGSHAYMPNAGYPETRAAMAAKASAEHGVAFAGERVVMSVGAAGGLNVVFKTLLNPGDEVICPSPYFVEYGSYAANHGGVLKPVPSGPGFQLDLRVIEAALTPATAIFLLNSPNNPTGVLYPEKDIAALGALLDAHAQKTGRRVALVVDEPYRDIVYGGKVTPPVAKHYADTIVVNSFSKSLSLPGERIGYVAVSPGFEGGDEVVAGLVMCTRTLGYVNAPALMQKAVARLAGVKMDMGRYERRRDMISEGLARAGYEFAAPDGAFYLFVKVPAKPEPAPGRPVAADAAGDDIAFVAFLKGYHILAVPGSGFGRPGWMRLSYAAPEAVIERGLPEFAKALEDWKRIS